MAATSVSDKVPPGAQPSNRLDAGALARIGDLSALLSEGVDPQCGAHVGRGGSLAVLDRDAGRVRDPIDSVERGDDRSCVDKRGIAHLVPDCRLDFLKAPVIVAEHRLGEYDQQRPVRNIAVALGPGQQA